jgi:hypothetical protein
LDSLDGALRDSMGERGPERKGSYKLQKDDYIWNETAFSSHLTFSKLTGEAVFSSELLVPMYQTTWQHIPADCNPCIHCCQNLESHISPIFDFEMKRNKALEKAIWKFRNQNVNHSLLLKVAVQGPVFMAHTLHTYILPKTIQIWCG